VSSADATSALIAPFDTPGFRDAVLADPQGATFSVSELRQG
jgi:hypothetical protein